MSGWWGWASRNAPRAAQNRDLPAPEVESEPECHPRLTGPRGRVVWICATGAGRKDDCNHDTEAQAEAHGAREGRVWWPVTIDEGYGETA